MAYGKFVTVFWVFSILIVVPVNSDYTNMMIEVFKEAPIEPMMEPLKSFLETTIDITNKIIQQLNNYSDDGKEIPFVIQEIINKVLSKISIGNPLVSKMIACCFHHSSLSNPLKKGMKCSKVIIDHLVYVLKDLNENLGSIEKIINKMDGNGILKTAATVRDLLDQFPKKFKTILADFGKVQSVIYDAQTCMRKSNTEWPKPDYQQMLSNIAFCVLL